MQNSSPIHRRLLSLQTGATRRRLREGKEWEMRRAVLLCLTVTGATLILASGIALAAVVQCVAGAATCVGTQQDDQITGTDDRDEVYAEGGNDRVDGYADDDVLYGDGDLPNDGNDRLYGDDGDDYLDGFGGNDRLYGDDDRDTIYAVELPPNPGIDYVRGGSGSDEIYAGDGFKDTIRCDTGVSDDVWYDNGIDVVAADCENLHPQ
jgi:Ca2+-binding RTX toxin-like protein